MLPCCLGLNSGRSVPINVKKTRKHFSRNIHAARMFVQCFPVSHVGKHCFQCQFLFQDANYAYATREGINFNENPSMRALARILRARTREDSSNFCEQFEQGPNIAWNMDHALRITDHRSNLFEIAVYHTKWITSGPKSNFMLTIYRQRLFCVSSTARRWIVLG